MENLYLADLTREGANQIIVGTVATMIAGAIFFFFGALLGWRLWRNAKNETERLTAANKELVQSYKHRKKSFNALKLRLGEVTLPEEVDY